MRFISLIFWVLIIQTIGVGQNPLDVYEIRDSREFFHTFLLDRGAQLWDARRDSVAAALTSVESIQRRKQQLKSDYIKLLGDMPVKTPLNAEVVDTLLLDSFRIEKLTYQSRPNFHVTANFYIPNGDGPFPAVLVMCGHYPTAKSADILQRLCILFANNGIAAMMVDPFSQGERYQILNPNTGNLQFLNESGTMQHTRLDVGAMLTGTSVVAQALWDNHRGIDYLYARTDIVDTSRVGCTGSSGGGAQATYLTAFDERIKVSAVNSYIMTEEVLFNTIGPQTGSQNLSYEGAHSIEHADYITMFAPKPFMILAGSKDFFDTAGTHQTYREVQDVYALLGASEKIGYFEENADHGYLQPRREEAVRWFRTWFYNDTSVIMEPEDLMVQARSDLEVTETGQVMTNFEDEINLTAFNVALADSLASERTAFWSEQTLDSCLNRIEELLRLEPYDSVSVELIETFDREGYTVDKIVINSGDHVPVTGLLMIPDSLNEPVPGVLYVDGRGKRVDGIEDGILEHIFVDSNKVVLSIDVRGFGETEDFPGRNESKHGNREHRNAVIAGYIGKTLIGQRVEDIQKSLDVLLANSMVDATDITLVGIDRAGSAVVHAAALDSRVTNTVIRQGFESWMPIVATPTQRHNLTHVVPFALKYYDIPDLVNALPPNAVKFYDELYTIPTVSNKKYEALHKGSVGQNYPNPTAGITVIPYQLREGGDVSIKVYDVQGRQIFSIDRGFQTAGTYTEQIDIRNETLGQYFYQVWVNGIAIGSKKLIISE